MKKLLLFILLFNSITFSQTRPQHPRLAHEGYIGTLALPYLGFNGDSLNGVALSNYFKRVDTLDIIETQSMAGVGLATKFTKIDSNTTQNPITLSYAINNFAPISTVSSQWVTNGNDIYYTAGNVGIGTTSPGAKLDVNGVIKAAVTTSNTEGVVVVGDGLRTTNYVGMFRSDALTGGTNSYLSLGAYNGIIFNSSNAVLGSQTERMRITSGGNVGIGTTVDIPGLLTVNGRLWLGTSSVYSYCDPAGNWVTSSSSTKKTNITDFAPDLSKFKLVKPKNYNFKKEFLTEIFNEKSIPDSVTVKIDSVRTKIVSNRTVKDSTRTAFHIKSDARADSLSKIPYVGIMADEFGKQIMGKDSVAELDNAKVTAIMWLKIQELEAKYDSQQVVIATLKAKK